MEMDNFARELILPILKFHVLHDNSQESISI